MKYLSNTGLHYLIKKIFTSLSEIEYDFVGTAIETEEIDALWEELV